MDSIRPQQTLTETFILIRQQTERLCAPLEVEDYGVQSMAEASPAKWHLAHTSWFFEQMVLCAYLKNYQPYCSDYLHLFNSYYESLGTYYSRSERGLLSRPTVKEVYGYRRHIDQTITQLLANDDLQNKDEIKSRIILGLNHEQQHQELLLTDIKHAFSKNPLHPVYLPAPQKDNIAQKKATNPWLSFDEGIFEMGHDDRSFAYDNEMPAHKVFLSKYSIASQLVTNGEFEEFIRDGGYANPEHWHSDAWDIISQEAWQAPLYWHKSKDHWSTMSLHGLRPIDSSAPVCHVSWYEAAAYARWKGKRLPTEAEWENAAQNEKILGNPYSPESLEPEAANTKEDDNHFFRTVWQWTNSAYTEYPGYHRQSGPLGEYNAKFMSGQMVLRGGSCLTPATHIRPSYRNFFYPHTRWQYSGIRLAEDL